MWEAWNTGVLRWKREKSQQLHAVIYLLRWWTAIMNSNSPRGGYTGEIHVHYRSIMYHDCPWGAVWLVMKDFEVETMKNEDDAMTSACRHGPCSEGITFPGASWYGYTVNNQWYRISRGWGRCDLRVLVMFWACCDLNATRLHFYSCCFVGLAWPFMSQLPCQGYLHWFRSLQCIGGSHWTWISAWWDSFGGRFSLCESDELILAVDVVHFMHLSEPLECLSTHNKATDMIID